MNIGRILKSPIGLILIGWTIKSVMDGKSPIPGVPMFGLAGGDMGAFTNQRIPGNVASFRNVGTGAVHPY